VGAAGTVAGRGHEAGSAVEWTKRQLIDGIRWRVRVGAPWRDVPDCYGSWQAVYSLFRRWQRAGVWQRIVTALRARADAVGLIGRISTPPGPAPGRTSRKNLRVESATERAASPLITRLDVRVAG